MGVDEASGEIVAAVVTTNNSSDSQVLPDLLVQVEEESVRVSGDGGYDRSNCYETIGGPSSASYHSAPAQRQDLATRQL